MTGATISAATVKQLRESTGAGMMECKNALKESAGDFDGAVQILRKAGQAHAEKRAGRIAAEGIIAVAHNESAKTYAIAEVNCETDFVSRDDQFVAFVNALIAQLSTSDVNDDKELEAMSLEGGSVEDARRELITKIGENIQVRRFERMPVSGDHHAQYVHNGRIAVIVDMEGGNDEVAKDIALHIAASAPMCIDADEVPSETLDKEKEIYRAQAQESGKPDNILDKIVEGKMRKYLDSVTLLGQPFVKDPDMNVKKFLDTNKATVKAFRRYEVGEGIEKAEDDFVEEVMSQASKASG